MIPGRIWRPSRRLRALTLASSLACLVNRASASEDVLQFSSDQNLFRINSRPHSSDPMFLQHEFILRHAFHHDMEDTHAPPLIIDAHASEQMAQMDSHDKVNLLSPLTIQSRPSEIARSKGRSKEKSEAQYSKCRSSKPGYTSEPDVSDRATIINLAKMTSDAYVLAPTEPDWINTTMGFNRSYTFGWVGDGLRGHVFTDQQNETVIVAFKGTTIDPRNSWTAKDRLNDNILFSCCCGDQRPDPYPYGPVCGCWTDTYQCNTTCVTEELIQKDRYYPTALAVMHNVTSMYPNSSFWMVGHSMGGAVASLIGLTFDLPTVTFEAPGQKLPADRLGLSNPPVAGTFHFGNTADPVYMGACNGWTSSCGLAGYAFESQCFTGKRCVYDTVGDKGWHLNIGNHRINTVITEVLEKYDSVPDCAADDECFDCSNWKFDPSQIPSTLVSST